MVTVSEKSYKEIEASLERYWNSTPWPRIWENGLRKTYEEVVKRFDLVCEEIDDKMVRVYLVSKDNDEHKPYYEVFERFL